MKGLTVFFVMLIMVVYVIVGGVVFSYIESSAEEDSQVAAVDARQLMLVNNTCLSEEDLDRFIIALQRAQDAGVSLAGNQTSETQWDIASSIFFAMTVATTIGYGHISPSTSGGKVFCVFFALVGIPLFLVASSGVGQRMKVVFLKLTEKGKKCHSSKAWEYSLRFIVFLISLFVFLFMPALVFYLVETDWSYGTSLYYSIITMTTIGFGDYVAGQDDSAGSVRVLYRLLVAVWILTSLAWMASLITIGQEALSGFVQKEEEKSSTIEPSVENGKSRDQFDRGGTENSTGKADQETKTAELI